MTLSVTFHNLGSSNFFLSVQFLNRNINSVRKLTWCVNVLCAHLRMRVNLQRISWHKKCIITGGKLVLFMRSPAQVTSFFYILFLLFLNVSLTFIYYS